MRKSIVSSLGSVALVVGTAVVVPVAVASPAPASEEVPGMCTGRSDANVVLNALARASGAAPKFILNVSTDPTGEPTGTLILGKAGERVELTDLCRVWQHLPDQPSDGSCEMEYPEGAVTAHAVGVGTRSGGQHVLVRADLRETSEGRYFRVRYRDWPPGGAHEDGDHGVGALPTLEQHEGEGCEDETWTRVPLEEWLPLHQFKLRVVVPER